jgi:hypothetical protein
MSSFEFEGKNLNKAVKNACEKLSLFPDEIKYDVLFQRKNPGSGGC